MVVVVVAGGAAVVDGAAVVAGAGVVTGAEVVAGASAVWEQALLRADSGWPVTSPEPSPPTPVSCRTAPGKVREWAPRGSLLVTRHHRQRRAREGVRAGRRR